MNVDEEFNEIERRLDLLTPAQAVIFCVCCAERLLPNYARFSAETGWGDPRLLRSILDYCWAAIYDDLVDVKSIDENIRVCDSITPDTEDFRVQSVSMALDAAVTVRVALECMKYQDSGRAKIAAQNSFDTVDLYLRSEAQEMKLEGAAEQVFVDSHPLMQQELIAQKELIVCLRNSAGSMKESASLLRGRCFNSGISNLGFVQE